MTAELEILKNIGCEVIRQAVTDCKMQVDNGEDQAIKNDALDFIATDRLDNHISLYGLDLNPEYVRRGVLGR